MKKSIFIIVLVFAGTIAAVAQGGFQQRTVEERVQTIHAKMDSAFKLEPAKLTQADSAFASYYRGSDKIREELSAGGQPDFQAIRERTQPLRDERDAKLKTILSEADYKTWKEVIEPSMRPQRRNN